MRVLIAPDKFKGTLSAADVAAHLRVGLLAGAADGLECEVLPLADGGDGTVDAMVGAGFAAYAVAGSVDGSAVPANRVGSPDSPDSPDSPNPAVIAFDGTTAVVEVANACGLALLAQSTHGDLRPLAASSARFGEAVRFALGLAPRRLILGLGGSASTDGGTGMLTALGAVFRDDDGQVVDGSGADLARIRSVDLAGIPSMEGVELVVATDVTNPLLGPDGAAAVFAPQKGASPDDVVALEAGLTHLVDVLGAAGRADATTLAAAPGAGAAGGIGFACLLLGATPCSGAGVVLDVLGFDRLVARADVVVTGEGRMDAQTLSGKLPAVVAERSRPRSVYAVVGRDDLGARALSAGFTAVLALVDVVGPECATDADLSATGLERIGRDLGQRLTS